MNTGINKSFATNFLAVICVAAGFLVPEPYSKPVLSIGLFALSGAITNWLAIHMLFEKVPGLYGSGVIPDRFEDFKEGINKLIMEQFFTKENVKHFFEDTATAGEGTKLDFGPVIENADFNPAFNALVTVITESPFGGMLNMMGGTAALDPLREPFTSKMKYAIKEMAQSKYFRENIGIQFAVSVSSDEIHSKVGGLVQKRLNELTPIMVKEIIQQMIRDHLGWLVVWGGIFGGLIGLVTAFLPILK